MRTLESYYFKAPDPELDIAGLHETARRSSREEIGMALSWCVHRRNNAMAFELIQHPCPEECYNFALQHACSNGDEPLAKALLPLSSIISVSRSLKKAAYAKSPACLRLLFSRLDQENGWIPFDNAIALRDAAEAGGECLSMLAEKSCSGALSWALREQVLSGKARAFRDLLAVGANPDETPQWPPASGNRMWDQLSPRACFGIRAGSSSLPMSTSDIEAILLEMDVKRAEPSMVKGPRV